MRQHKFTIIGFNKHNKDVKYYHCQIHQGSRLIPFPEEEGYYYCTECGVPYNPSDVKSDTRITSRFATIEGGQQKPIQSAHNRSLKQKEYYDKSGHKLNKNDPDIMQDVAEGHTIEYYYTNEDLNSNKDTPPTYTVRR